MNKEQKIKIIERINYIIEFEKGYITTHKHTVKELEKFKQYVQNLEDVKC